MKKILGKIIVLMAVFIMCFGLFVGCDSNYEYVADDFELIIKVDKTEVQVGDIFVATATLKNLSGHNVRVQMSHTRYKKPEDMLLISCFEENSEHEFIVTSEMGPLSKITLEKDVSVTRTIEFTAKKEGVIEVVCLVTFLTGREYDDQVSIYSDTIKISIG